MTSQTLPYIAIGISSGSLLVAASSLAWQVYRAARQDRNRVKVFTEIEITLDAAGAVRDQAKRLLSSSLADWRGLAVRSTVTVVNGGAIPIRLLDATLRQDEVTWVGREDRDHLVHSLDLALANEPVQVLQPSDVIQFSRYWDDLDETDYLFDPREKVWVSVRIVTGEEFRSDRSSLAEIRLRRAAEETKQPTRTLGDYLGEDKDFQIATRRGLFWYPQ